MYIRIIIEMWQKINFQKTIRYNDNIANIFIFISWIVLICGIISYIIIWKQTKNFSYIIAGTLSILGICLNIYLLLKAKSRKNKR
jgi:F0F1-type ATP synthase assembly protein I